MAGSVGRAAGRQAALGHFEDAGGVYFGGGPQSDDVIVTSEFAFQTQLPAGITHQRMEKEDGPQRRLKEIDPGITAFEVRQFVSDHGGALGGRRPVDDVEGQDDDRS